MVDIDQVGHVRYRVGGLKRCCLETLEKRAPRQPAENAQEWCDHCGASFRYRDWAWEYVVPGWVFPDLRQSR